MTRNSRIPAWRKPSTMCCKTGLPRTSIIGFGKSTVSSRIRVPRPAARMTALSILGISELALRSMLKRGGEAAIVYHRPRSGRSTFAFKSRRRSLRVAPVAALQFPGKYREGGLLLIRASLGLIFIALLAPVLWTPASWDHLGSAMRHLDFHSHFKFWGIVGALLGCVGGVLMVLGLFFRIGVLCALIVTIVDLIATWSSHGGFFVRLPALEMSILLVSLLLVGPGKYSVDKN